MRIRDGVARALNGDDDLPEEVYAACRANRAALYVGEDAAFVLRWAGNGRIRVWVAVGWGGNTLSRYDDELARICRDAGAAEMVFMTRRPGFRRALPATWRAAETTYARRL